ncbi:MAG: carbohydrate binding family 9 domain-containing protein [Gemmatimonadetes bacterium]|nr:carbohydrate binding family 9 domain-containing protein [Gemmatimonadota bacterium]
MIGLAATEVPARAQSADGLVPVATAVRASGPIVIDGVLDEAAWSAAVTIGEFVQLEPFEGRPPTERTEVRVLYDDEAVYVGAWLYDRDPGAIVLGETRRDADLRDTDAFRILLDTYLDRQNGFVFGTTPAGIEYDGQVTREGQGGFGGQVRQQRGSGGGFNVNWDGSWDVATSRDANGWYAEFRIPFRTLRYDRSGPQRWGLNVSRNLRRNNEESVWSPLPRQFDFYRVSLAGTIEGIEAPPQRAFTVTPYVLGSGRRDHVADSTAFDGDIGMDAKIGLTPGLTLDVTVNTDFAQVEVDEEQVNLTRFSLFFPEKRPFFLENAGTFALGTAQEVEIFFSRRVGIESGLEVPILGGGRVTGKAGGFTLGLLDIQTNDLEVTNADGQRVRLAAPNNTGVVRVLREFANRSRLGVAAISRVNTDDVDDHNFTWVVDGRLGIGASLTVDGYAAFTNRLGVHEGQHAASLSASWTSRDWSMGLAGREVGENFRPDVGFVPRTAYRFTSARILRNIRTPDVPWFRELRPHISYREFRDLDGFSETRLIHMDSHFEFANGAFFQLPALNFTREGLKEPFEIAAGIMIQPGTYDNFEWGFEYNSNRGAPVSIQGRVDIGGFYSGTRWGTGSTVNARLSETFIAALRMDYFDVDLDEGSFITRLYRLRAAYSFSPRTYLQALLQYNDQSNAFSSNVRFGWLNTAGTGLFIVYNDTENTGSFEETGFRRGPVDRTFVIKFTRQFDFGR